MKKVMKKMVVAVLAVVMVFSLVGCGEISYDDISGEWTVTKVNGASIDDWATQQGIDPATAYTNYTIKDDDTFTSTNAAGTQTLKLQRKSDGFEVLQDGSSDIMFSVAYDSDAKTLSYAVEVSGTKYSYTLEKGTKEISAVSTTPAAATDAAQ